MQDGDVQEADRIMRLAFGTFLGLPDPMAFAGDADYVRSRYLADPASALVAEDSDSGRIVGSNFALDWGSVGVFGPLTVHPEFWDRGVARRLLEGTMDIFSRWGTRHVGPFTFAQSSKHVHLYQKFGFWPRFLTAVMSKQVAAAAAIADNGARPEPVLYSQLGDAAKARAIEACRSLTGEIYGGLDLEKEVRSVDRLQLGDTLLLYDGDSNSNSNSSDGSLAAFAVCHCGPGTEAGSGNCYVKFGASRPGSGSAEHFDALLGACESFTVSQGLSRVVAGVNTARHGAYRSMVARNFRTDIQGVAMHRPNEPGYNREDAYVIDDWR
jgi:GNAT superfamily N-acetyltransferase